ADLGAAIAETGGKVTRDDLPTVVADGLQLRQVFQNLIGNAIKFHGEQPPRVQVSAEPWVEAGVDRRAGQPRPYWRFAVRDNGIGVEPQYAERIFVLFQRLHTWADCPGTGIGLAI